MTVSTLSYGTERTQALLSTGKEFFYFHHLAVLINIHFFWIGNYQAKLLYWAIVGWQGDQITAASYSGNTCQPSITQPITLIKISFGNYVYSLISFICLLTKITNFHIKSRQTLKESLKLWLLKKLWVEISDIPDFVHKKEK
jgi:hypothetical protein